MDDLSIGPIQHLESQCRRDSCDCWCAVCEQHNRRLAAAQSQLEALDVERLAEAIAAHFDPRTHPKGGYGNPTCAEDIVQRYAALKEQPLEQVGAGANVASAPTAPTAAPAVGRIARQGWHRPWCWQQWARSLADSEMSVLKAALNMLHAHAMQGKKTLVQIEAIDSVYRKLYAALDRLAAAESQREALRAVMDSPWSLDPFGAYVIVQVPPEAWKRARAALKEQPR